MDKEKAEKIVELFANHMENDYGKLLILFGVNIPESFLPASKNMIAEAIKGVIEMNSNEDYIEKLKMGLAFLDAYKDDNECIVLAANQFSNLDWRKVTISSLKKFQIKFLKAQGLVKIIETE